MHAIQAAMFTASDPNHTMNEPSFTPQPTGAQTYSPLANPNYAPRIYCEPHSRHEICFTSTFFPAPFSDPTHMHHCHTLPQPFQTNKHTTFSPPVFLNPSSSPHLTRACVVSATRATRHLRSKALRKEAHTRDKQLNKSLWTPLINPLLPTTQQTVCSSPQTPTKPQTHAPTASKTVQKCPLWPILSAGQLFQCHFALHQLWFSLFVLAWEDAKSLKSLCLLLCKLKKLSLSLFLV